MTGEQKTSNSEAPAGPLSLPGVPDVASLLRVRVRPSELSRLMGFSRQSVSRWIRAGVFTVGADGRVDAAAAMRAIFLNVDAGKLRSRVLRSAFADLEGLRRAGAEADSRVAAIAQQLDQARRQAATWEGMADRYGRALAHLTRLIVAEAEELLPLSSDGLVLALDSLQEEAWKLAADPAAPAAAATTSTGEYPSEWEAHTADAEALDLLTEEGWQASAAEEDDPAAAEATSGAPQQASADDLEHWERGFERVRDAAAASFGEPAGGLVLLDQGAEH